MQNRNVDPQMSINKASIIQLFSNWCTLFRGTNNITYIFIHLLLTDFIIFPILSANNILLKLDLICVTLYNAISE